MKFKIIIVYSILSVIFMTAVSANNNRQGQTSFSLPPMETLIIEPIEVEQISIWVPAGKVGPVINNSCMPKKDNSDSCELPAIVNHTKTQSCPEGLARLLAEYTAPYHEQNLPLTIFNGWQWDYFYSLSQFENVSYELPKRGGCWENSWEAVLNQSIGTSKMQWLSMANSNRNTEQSDYNKQDSQIEIQTFTSMRTRNGYPKERQLEN